MEFDVTPVFPTLIGRFRVPDADAMNQDLQTLILVEEQYPSIPTYYLIDNPALLSSEFVPVPLRQTPKP